MTEEATRVNNYKTNNKRFYSGSTVVLQWLYSGSTTNKRRTMNEPKAKESYLNIEY
ncbi:Uncharacterised protein [Capnocytophaga ochracea]|uniref:Uncharacterized protein n=1 Tax=Capnocytophaga ochracea TaxID=1018 RepID=A0A2X1J1U0_CAPOC|nr:hypothetical protein [Capnocytophaga ochracea]SPV25461.1 Uncharacterised protein [Capnocytophaga ochracea]SPV25467.1 Uncharacterised protein [Capnocytophaga ochracea]SQA76956.1 Uncharacterised protein [Capnocytophaga ochracea]